MFRFGMLSLCLFLCLSSTVLAADGITVGDAAPEFELTDVRTGSTVALGDFSEKEAVAVIFIATQCPYSNAFNGVMADLAQRYGEKGVAFVGINSNKTEPAEEVSRHAEENGFGFPVLKDPGNRIADLYGATVTPEVFLVGQSGEVVYHGAIGNSKNPTTRAAGANGEELSLAINELLANEPLTRTQTKMFGCTIKR